ncbi:diguanylate cyclase [Selenomonas ruminantium]|uniref:sensor domain-containing diguanylate cyclase n=1 Tax=Selenomonas ruminantium TaxID=971 RepID=UPI001567F23D|nr:diguanylate cyclase [Selenomonas ruminantium]
MFHSIKFQILAMCMTFMLILALGMGSVSVMTIDRLTGEHEAENLNRVAENQRAVINTQLIHAEDVTKFVANEVKLQVAAAPGLPDKEMREFLSRSAKQAFQNAVGNMDVVCSYYVYYADELNGSEENLWRVRPAEGEDFEDRPLGLVSSYAADDAAHTSWYKLPVEKGHGMWVPPYYYDVQGRYLLSYVTPVYKDKKLVAVIGVDLDFRQLLSRIEHVPSYNSGQAFLTDLSGRIHYTLENPDGIESTRGGQLISSTGKFFVPNTHSKELMRYNWSGKEYDMAVVSLRNELALMVAAPVHETYAEAMYKIIQLCEIFLLLVVISAVFCFLVSTRMTKKLTRLTEVSHEVAAGNFDVAVPEGGNDEIGDLCRAFANAASQLKRNQEDMEKRSNHDALTGLFNRFGVERELKGWWTDAKTAVMMTLDIDDFKFINDLYGHVIGDEVLKKLSRILLSYFGDVGIVGRNGGDEFIVILKDISMVEAERRIADFCSLPKSFTVGERGKTFSVSVGVSIYPDLADDLTALFRQSDEALYGVKLKGKNGYVIYDAELEQQVMRTRLGFNLHNVSCNLPAAILIYKIDPQNTLLYASGELLRLTGDESLDALQQRTDGSALALVDEKERNIFHKESESENTKIFRYHLWNVQRGAVEVEICHRLELHPLYGTICYAVMLEREK